MASISAHPRIHVTVETRSYQVNHPIESRVLRVCSLPGTDSQQCTRRALRSLTSEHLLVKLVLDLCGLLKRFSELGGSSVPPRTSSKIVLYFGCRCRLLFPGSE